MPKPRKRPKSAPPTKARFDLPQSEIEISGIRFNIEFIEVPDAKERWSQALHHLGDWLLAEWESEQAAETRRYGSQSVQPGA